MKKQIIISKHCYDIMKLRGVKESEIIETISNSSKIFISGIRYYAEKII
jgi:hypothetical protein